jgi:hypothetical protein
VIFSDIPIGYLSHFALQSRYAREPPSHRLEWPINNRVVVETSYIYITCRYPVGLCIFGGAWLQESMPQEPAVMSPDTARGSLVPLVLFKCMYELLER